MSGVLTICYPVLCVKKYSANQNPPLTQYEKDRISRLKKNDEKLEEHGIRPLLTSLKSFDVQNSNRKSKVDEEYHPEEEID
ncbi:hypothetical protein OROMI_000686 [Orobanche minor]